jgi:anti-sigma regulatory factor (Ser/Thr protein kinase)
MPVSFSLALPRDAAASFVARESVREHLADAVPAATLADVTLAVSELVTNAVLHGSGQIELRIEADQRRVKGEVIDEGGGFERQIRADGGIDDVAGRGLLIVGALAEHWGVHEGTTHVWFEIAVTPGNAVVEPELDGEVDVDEPELGKPPDDRLPDV